MTVPLWVVLAVGALLGVALILVLIRLLLAKTLLDRVVALDTVLTVIVCAIGTLIAITGNTAYVPVLLALSLLAFIGSVTVARLGPVRDHRGGKR